MIRVSARVCLWLGVVVISLSARTVRAADTAPPVISVSNKSVQCSGPTTSVFLNPRVTDNIDPLPRVSFNNQLHNSDPDDYPLGSRVVTISASDASGNTASRSVTVAVRDTAAPSISMQLDTTQECSSPSGTTVPVTWTVADVCDPSPKVTNTAPQGFVFPYGTTLFDVVATDAYGNRSSKLARVTVTDRTAPTIVGGPDLVVVKQNNCDAGSGAGSGTTVELPAPKVTDACSAPQNIRVTLQSTAFTTRTDPRVCLPPGTFLVTWTAYDERGNTAQDSMWVNVLDTSAFSVTATATPSGFANGTVTLSAAASGVAGPVSWTIASTNAPDSQSPAPTTLSATFGAEGRYCPLFVFGTIGGVGAGAPSTDPCFAIDKQAPTQAFTGIATTYVDVNDPAKTLPVDPGDVATWPVYNQGERLTFEVNAADQAGIVQSGIASIKAVLDPAGTPRSLIDRTFCAAAANTLPTCAASQHLVGCDQATTACTPVASGGDGLLDTSGVGGGGHVLRVTVTDLAGNQVSKDYPFIVGDMVSAIDAQIRWTESLLADPRTPMAALPFIREAHDLFVTAQRLYYDEGYDPPSISPGHSFLLCRQAYGLLDQAKGAGVQVDGMMRYLASAIAGEVREIVDLTAAQAFTDWRILGNEGASGDDPMSLQRYLVRDFLMRPGGVLRDYTVRVEQTLSVARSQQQRADMFNRQAQPGSAIDAALAAYDNLVLLYHDQVLADLLGVAVHETEAGSPEAYFRGSLPRKLGDRIAATVAAQTSRIAADPGIPAAVKAQLVVVDGLIQQFATAIGKIRTADWEVIDSGLDNEGVTRDIYLNAATALQKLDELQRSSIYTYYWRGGIALTLAMVINFSLYEGPASFYVIAGDEWLPPDGDQVDAVNVPLQTAECRYNRIMRALTDRSDVDQAVVLFNASKCLIISLYNQYFSSGAYLLTDDFIDPVAYGCTGAAPSFVLRDECSCIAGAGNIDATCNGVDDDCDGQLDEDYVASSCGVGPCAAQSQCVNGIEVPCTPKKPQSAIDTTCNGVDDDCDTRVDDDWVGDTCGLGGCKRSATCINGLYAACVPGTPGTEVCNGVDDDCDVLADEGLDNDLDGSGCAPGSAGCVRASASDRRCAADNGTIWDCNDDDPNAAPSKSEVCDYIDNDCDGAVDEGLRNMCDTCTPNCSVSTYGIGGIAFNPTPSNSSAAKITPDAALTVTSEDVNVSYAWIANDGGGKVSKIDTRTGVEVGRYCAAIKTDPFNKGRGVANVCQACGGCNRGSRTAVDQNLNVYLANRAFDYQGTVTKIAAIKQNCIDFNGNGVIDTSTDVNGNGVIDEGDAREYFGQADECIIWTRKPTTTENGSYEARGEGYFLPRAVAVDGDGDIWLGNWMYAGFFEMDANTGRVKRFVSMGVYPYGAVIDRNGILWSTNSCCGTGQIRSFNTTSRTVTIGATTWQPGALGPLVQQPAGVWWR